MTDGIKLRNKPTLVKKSMGGFASGAIQVANSLYCFSRYAFDLRDASGRPGNAASLALQVIPGFYGTLDEGFCHGWKKGQA
jgi:hypothetical protein